MRRLLSHLACLFRQAWNRAITRNTPLPPCDPGAEYEPWTDVYRPPLRPR